ncbi:MAG: hypothetical protein ABI797_06285 [Chloroflexota bacterium]
MNAEDERLGRLLRLIRRRSGQTQVELAIAAQVPLNDLKFVEAGRAEGVRLGRVRALFEAVDARARVVPWWNGAAADRLLDERHAAVGERAVRFIETLDDWLTEMEVSFSEFGERGSIDLLATDRKAGAAAVGEIKSAIGSLEETNRMLDVKVRLAPTIVFKRHGWRPKTVAKILIVPRDMSIRREIEKHEATMRSAYPARSREIRAWFRKPAEPISGIWFVTDGQDGTAVRR